MSSLSKDYLLYDAIFKWLQWVLMNKSMWYDAAQVLRNNLVIASQDLGLGSHGSGISIRFNFSPLSKGSFFTTLFTQIQEFIHLFMEKLCPLSGKMVITSAKKYLKLLTCIHVQNVDLYRLVYNLC